MKRIFYWCLLACAFVPIAQAGRAVIIIDDIGYNLQAGLEVARLPFPVTLAIIPFSPYAKHIAKVAKDNGKDVIVHAPMASLDGRMIDQGGLRQGMSEQEFVDTVNRQLAAVPNAIGLNNHMGSLLTQKYLAMSWLMQTLKQKQLYFIDSRTTAQSVAQKTAIAYGVTNWRRDVFLDHHRDAESINSSVQSLLPLAQSQGLVVAIGHPHDATISALTQSWQQLKSKGLQFVSPSNLINEKLLARDSSQIIDAIFE